MLSDSHCMCAAVDAVLSFQNRKEVNAMNDYGKPEIVTLGEAVRVVQGSKVGKLDPDNMATEQIADCTSED